MMIHGVSGGFKERSRDVPKSSRGTPGVFHEVSGGIRGPMHVSGFFKCFQWISMELQWRFKGFQGVSGFKVQERSKRFMLSSMDVPWRYMGLGGFQGYSRGMQRVSGDFKSVPRMF